MDKNNSAGVVAGGRADDDGDADDDDGTTIPTTTTTTTTTSTSSALTASLDDEDADVAANANDRGCPLLIRVDLLLAAPADEAVFPPALWRRSVRRGDEWRLCGWVVRNSSQCSSTAARGGAEGFGSDGGQQQRRTTTPVAGSRSSARTTTTNRATGGWDDDADATAGAGEDPPSGTGAGGRPAGEAWGAPLPAEVALHVRCLARPPPAPLGASGGGQASSADGGAAVAVPSCASFCWPTKVMLTDNTGSGSRRAELLEDGAMAVAASSPMPGAAAGGGPPPAVSLPPPPAELGEIHPLLLAEDGFGSGHGGDNSTGQYGCPARVLVFSAWILDTLLGGGRGEQHSPASPRAARAVGTESRAATSTSIVDVAGGRGDLAMMLSLRGVASTMVVDPRRGSGCLKGAHRKLLRRHRRPRPRAWRLFFPPPSVRPSDGSVDAVTVSLDLLDKEAAGKGEQAVPDHQPEGRDHAMVQEQKQGHEQQQQQRIDREWSRLADQLQRCSAVIGLHPDEATEAIVDWALQNRKTFAVVPCCVYSRLFPNRFLRTRAGSGATTATPVHTLGDFLRYLSTKHPSIRAEKLPFDGPNIVLWARGEDL